MPIACNCANNAAGPTALVASDTIYSDIVESENEINAVSISDVHWRSPSSIIKTSDNHEA